LGYQLSKKEKTLLSLFIIILGVYLYLTFFLFPKTEKMKQIKNYLNNHKNISIKNKELNENKKYVEERFLPYEEKINEIANNIKTYADKSNVKLIKISFGDCGTLNNSLYIIKYVPIYISFIGKNNNKITYLNMIENDKRVCEINDINIDYKDEENSEASANIKYYFLADSKAISNQKIINK
jgi:hypothetical protein